VCVGKIVRLSRIDLEIIEFRQAVRATDVLVAVRADGSERAAVFVDGRVRGGRRRVFRERPSAAGVPYANNKVI